jgi:hypothetical protein
MLWDSTSKLPAAEFGAVPAHCVVLLLVAAW